MRSPKLTVIVPAYREGPRIRHNLARLLAELDQLGITYEVIVVSDGNTDETVSEAQQVGSDFVRVLSYPLNQGKGFALMHGVRSAAGEMIAFIDADMELDPRSIGDYLRLQASGSYDVVVGSKRHPDSRVFYPPFRRFQSWIYQAIIRILFQLDVRDTQTGLKLFRGDVLRAVVPLLAVKRFAFDLEVLVVARMLGFRRIIEAPIDLRYRFESTTGATAAYKTLWDTAAIFYRLHFLRHYDRRLRQTVGSPSRRRDDITDTGSNERAL